MFRRSNKQQIFRILVYALLGLLINPVGSITSSSFIPSAHAGTTVAGDLETIGNYLRSNIADLRTPNWYSYTLDGTNQSISDGGLDMYDGGNVTTPWLISGSDLTNINSQTINASSINYANTSTTTVDGDFKYVALGYSASPDYRPLTVLGTRTTAGNPIGFQKNGNIGADGGGSVSSGWLYQGSTFNSFTVYAFYRQTYNASDPTVCDLYMLIGQSDWNSSFGSLSTYSASSTDSNGGYLISTGANTRNLLAISTLLSRPSGAQISTSELQSLVQTYTARIRSAIGFAISKVTFDSNSATSGVSSVDSVTQTSTGASVTLATKNTLARTGYTFAGWNTAANGTGTTYLAGASYTPASSITLYAQWNSYIQYAANGATSGSPPDSTTAKSSAAVTALASNTRTLARTNYTFGGWNTNETGTGTSYTAGLSTYASPGDITLYAQWNSTITYLGNGNTSGSPPAASSLYAGSTTLASNSGSLARTNFTFGGWNTNETGTGTSYAAGSSYSPTGNKSLYAQWNSVVTYNGNSQSTGSVPGNTTITGLSGTLATNSGSLTQSGKVFAGWNTNTAGTGTWYAAGSSYPNSGNVTLYAQWVTAVSITGSSTINVGQNIAYKSDTYTATYGLDTKTVTYSLSTPNSGITLETSTVTGTTYAFIRVASTVLAGTYIDTLTATDRMGATASLAVTITISAPLRWSVSNGSSVATTFGKSASLRLDVTNGFSGKSFTLTAASSPTSAGITLDTSTASSGFVTLNVASNVATGTYLETITARDSSGTQISTLITIYVNKDIELTQNGSVVGTSYSSLVFNGTNQAVKYAPSTKYQLGANWTIEWWQYQTATTNWPRVFSMGSSYLGVSLEGDYLYFWNNGWVARGASTGASRLNQWVHFAIVSNGGSIMIYQNGKALNASATSGGTISSTGAPATSNFYIGSKNALAGESFIGRITNFAMSKRVDYTGTSTTTQNFTPSTSMKVDANTVMALTAIGGASTYTDLSSYAATATQYVGPPTASNTHPGVAASMLELITTQGIEKASAPILANYGTGDKSFVATSNTSGVSSTLTTNQAVVTIGTSATSATSTTARVSYETLTATDAVGATKLATIKLTINPQVTLAATSLSPSTSAGIARTETVTASYGTGIKSFTYSSSPISAGISFSSSIENQLVMVVAKSTSPGTYYETITATDTLGDAETVVLTLTVNEGLSLASATGIAALTTTTGKAASLRVNALQGSGSKSFTLTHMGTSNASITIDTTNAASNYAILNVASAVTAGTYTESITVTDATGSQAQLRIVVTVNQALTLTYNGATSGAITLTTTAGTSIRSTAFTAALGTGNRILSLSGVNSGISLDTSTANIGYLVLGTTLTSQSSTSARTYYETITVTDSVSATSLRPVNIVVNPAIALTATTETITTTAGITATDTVTVTTGTGTGAKRFTLSISPAVSGLSLSGTTDSRTVISVGSTVSAGTYSVSVVATDSVSATSEKIINLVVNSPATFSGTGILSSTNGFALTSPIYAVTGGTGNKTLTVASSPAPTAGTISLSSSSSPTSIVVSSTVPVDTYTVTISATDSVGAVSTFPVTLYVSAPVTLSGNKTLTKEYGSNLSQVYQTNSGTAPFSFFSSSVCTSEFSTYVGNGTNGTLGQEYVVEKFGGIGTCNWNVPKDVSSVSVLTVGGGGGGGGGGWAGGGGAGGVVIAENYSVTPNTSVSITVGDGGSGGTTTTTCSSGSSPSQGNNGGDSSFNGTFTAKGGGGGGGYGWSSRNGCGSGKQGGSGGGSGEIDYSNTAAASNQQTFAGATSYGNSGGNTLYLSGIQAGAGGGGASAAGASTNSSSRDHVGGKGGDGVSLNITGSAVTYAGGGGGATCDNSCGGTQTAGAGGAGGGGRGGTSNISVGNGVNGLGGGGGGAQATSGGSGGSGVVIVRYAKVSDTATSNILTMRTLSTSTPGSIQLNAPSELPVATYTQTIKVTDANGSNGSTPVTVTLTVTKANPVTSLSIAGGGSSVVYGTPVLVSLTTNIPGNANFKLAGTTITGCGSKISNNGIASCSWTPSATGSAAITVTFTPTDSSNYNTITSSALNLTVTKAPAVTITFKNQQFTYSGNPVSLNRGFTIQGLSALDSITAITTKIVGTPNSQANNSYSSTNSPTLAGNYELSADSVTSFSSITYTGGVTSGNYEGITFIAGLITINRAANSLALNYGTNNSVVYAPSGLESPTVTSFGDGEKSFSVSTSATCSIDSLTGEITKLSAGVCSVTLNVAEGKNYLTNAISQDVTIAKAPRTITLASSSMSLKYGETATISIAISQETSTGTISFSMGSSTGCSFDESNYLLTATSGTATCTLTSAISEGTNYAAATSSSLSITLTKANALVVTLTPPVDIDFGQVAGDPSVTVEGLKNGDIADTTYISYSYVASGIYPYNSTTKPTGGNTYTVTPSGLRLSTGSLTNYQTTTYNAAPWTINRIQQDSLTATSLLQEGVTVPYDVQFAGGTSGGIVTMEIISGGTASGCTVNGNRNLQASSTGTCFIRLKMAGNQNYLDVYSDTLTVVIAKFIQNIFNFDSPSGGSGITINSSVPITVDVATCSTACVPTISSVSPTTAFIGDPIVITGVDFAGADQVIFNRSIIVTTFQIDNGGTTITVNIPVNVAPGEGTGSVSVRNGGKISFRFSGLTFKAL